MAQLEDLPADQRAVLQLVLVQGRSYEALASMLKISEQAVRGRALAGLEGIAAPPARLSAADRATVADWLLSQRNGDRRAAELLGEPGDARTWAADLRERLAPIARTELPELPSRSTGSDRSDTAAVREAPETRHHGGDGRSKGPDPRGRLPRPSRPLGAALLAALAVAVGLIVYFAVSSTGGSSSKGSSRVGTSTNGASTNATPANSTLGQANLQAVQAGSKARGVALLVVRGNAGQLLVRATNLSTTPGTYHGIWLTGPKVKPVMTGAVPNSLVKKGAFGGSALVPQNYRSYTAVVITLERGAVTQKPPATPGTPVLRGRLVIARG